MPEDLVEPEDLVGLVEPEDLVGLVEPEDLVDATPGATNGNRIILA